MGSNKQVPLFNNFLERQLAGGLDSCASGYVKTTYMLTPEQAHRLKCVAVDQKRNVSALAREAIDDYLAKIGAKA